MDKVSESSFFMVAAVTLFVASSWIESRAVQHYKRSECRVAEAAINYLARVDTNNDKVILARGNQLNGEIWHWLTSHLVGSVNTRGEYETPPQEGRFVLLQYPHILARSVPRSSLQFVPGLLTAIGLLGTFWGISTALSQFDFDQIDNSKILMDAAIKVLSGMKTAFFSSLVGLGSASLFMLVLAWGGWARKKHRDNLRSKLDKIAVLCKAEDAFQVVAQGLSDAAGTIKSLSSQAIGKAVGAELNPVFQQIRQELSTLKEIKADQGQEVLKNLIQELRTDVLQPIAQRLDRSAELTQSASQAVMNLQAELGTVSKSLADSIVTIQHFQKETLGRLEEFAGGLKQTLGQFQTETKTVLQEVAQEIKQGVDQSIVGMESQRVAFAESAEQAAATFRGIREDLQAALHTQAEQEKQMLQDVEERMMRILKAAHTAFQTQSNTLEKLGSEASTLMNHAKENLVGSLQNIDGMLQNTRLTVQDELERFREGYQTSLQDFFTQQNNLLESTLGAQRQGLAQVVEDLQTAFQKEATKRQELAAEVERSMTKIQGTVEVVNNLANAVGLNSGARLAQMQELSRDMGTQVLELKSAYQNLASQFNQSLQQGSEQLTKYLDKTAESEKRFFTDTDRATTQLCNSLLQAANYLVAAEDNRKRELQALYHD